MAESLNELLVKKKEIPWKRGEKIGIGAYKTVYKGYNTAVGTECAWNEVPIFGLSPKESMKIFQEIMLLKSLNSPYIIHIKDSWSEKDKIIFITDLLSSGTLKGYIKTIGKVSLHSVKKWSTQILRGISYLHGRGIIHRDIKCENIFMNGIRGDVKVGDLGLSVIKDHAESKKLSVIGTTPFVAPELYKQDYNEKVDIYAFGMALLELVTGDYPYSECENDYQIIKKVTSSPRVPPEGLKKVKDPLLLEFISYCIEDDPEVRRSADELLEDKFLIIDDDADGEVFFNYKSEEDEDEEEDKGEPFNQPIFDFRRPKEVLLTPTKEVVQVIRSDEENSVEKNVGKPQTPPKIVGVDPLGSDVEKKGESSKSKEENEGGGESNLKNENIGGTKIKDENMNNNSQEIDNCSDEENSNSSYSDPSIPSPGGRPEKENGGSQSKSDGLTSNSKNGNSANSVEKNQKSEKSVLTTSNGKTEKSAHVNFRSHTKNLCKILIEQKSSSRSSLNVYLLIKNSSSSPCTEKSDPDGNGESELKEIAFRFHVTNDTAEEISEELYRSCADFIGELSEKDINLVCEAIKQALSSVKPSNKEDGGDNNKEKKKELVFEPNQLSTEETGGESGTIPQEGESQTEGNDGEEAIVGGTGETEGEDPKKKTDPPKLEDLVGKMEELLFHEDDD